MTKDVQRYADVAMFKAESLKGEDTASTIAGDEVDVVLLSCNNDPLGSIAAASKAYKGEFVSSLAEITDDERKYYLAQMRKTILAMPLEAVNFQFRIKGLHRGITHQMVRQRTAAYSQESTRFAVKEDVPVAYPPVLFGTVGELEEIKQDIRAKYPAWTKPRAISQEFEEDLYTDVSDLPYPVREALKQWDNGQNEWEFRSSRVSLEEAWRGVWDKVVAHIERAYNHMIDQGMPAEEARGLLPTNLMTQINYHTNLRNFQQEGGKRLCTQAQFEWRIIFSKMMEAIRKYGATQSYTKSLTRREADILDYFEGDRLSVSSEWQFEAIADLFKPVCYLTGKCQFEADFDRHCSIRDRVNWNASIARPSSEWGEDFEGKLGATWDKDEEGHPVLSKTSLGIPRIRDEEWLLDPASARVRG